MVQTYSPQLGNDISSGLQNLGSMFAPPTAQQLVAQQAIATSQASAAQKAAAIATIGQLYGAPAAALYGAGDNDALQHNDLHQQYTNSQADNPNIQKLDLGNYALKGNANDTFLGMLAKPQAENTATNLPPALAGAYGVPAQQHGVITLGDDSKMMPGSGQTPIVSAPASPDDNTPDFGKIGTDPNTGKDIYGYAPKYDPANPKAQPAMAGAASAAPIDPNLHGSDYLSALSPADAGVVKAIAEGRQALPTGTGANSSNAIRLRQEVAQYDPNFDVVNSQARIATRKAFTPGSSTGPGAAITAGLTAINHLGDLSDSVDQLGNVDTSIPGNNLLNALKNGVASTGASGAPLARFNSTVGKYVEEATKFYRGTGGTESDISRDLGNLSPNMSPTQLHAAIAQQVELMRGKVDSMQSQWHAGMGPLASDYPIITPQAQAVIDKVNRRAGIAPAQPVAAAPPTQTSSIAAGPGGTSANAAANASGSSPAAPPGTPAAAKPPNALPAPAAPPAAPGAAPPVPPAAPAVGDPRATIAAARDAISRGAPRDAVLQRLQKMGIDASGSGL